MPGRTAVELGLRVVRPKRFAVFQIETGEVAVGVVNENLSIFDRRRRTRAAVEKRAVLKFHRMLEAPEAAPRFRIETIDNQIIADAVANDQAPFANGGI